MATAYVSSTGSSTSTSSLSRGQAAEGTTADAGAGIAPAEGAGAQSPARMLRAAEATLFALERIIVSSRRVQPSSPGSTAGAAYCSSRRRGHRVRPARSPRAYRRVRLCRAPTRSPRVSGPRGPGLSSVKLLLLTTLAVHQLVHAWRSCTTAGEGARVRVHVPPRHPAHVLRRRHRHLHGRAGARRHGRFGHRVHLVLGALGSWWRCTRSPDFRAFAAASGIIQLQRVRDRALSVLLHRDGRLSRLVDALGVATRSERALNYVAGSCAGRRRYDGRARPALYSVRMLSTLSVRRLRRRSNVPADHARHQLTWGA